MDKLLAYLNSIEEDRRHVLAISCSTAVGYLRKACSVNQKIGPALCVAIERATNGAVTRRDLRPNDWHLIWPELIDADHPAPVEAAA